MSNNIPEIRFKGFTHAWEQRTLGEVAEFSKGSGYSKGDLTDSGTPIILYGRIYTNYETVMENVDTYATLKDKSVLSQGGEVIVPSSGETAEDISRASVVGKAGTILGGDLNIIKTDSTISPSFLAISISNGKQQKELRKRAQGKSVVHIGNSDLKEVVLNCPSIPEQTAIGNFFRTLDDTITLHKRKLEELKKLKSAYLQQMFPQAGENLPRIRFAGFTGPWQERTLGDVVKRITRKNKDLESTLALTISAQYGLIAQKDFFNKEVASKDVSNYYLVKNGEFAYNKSYSNGYPWGAIKRLDKYDAGVLSTLYIVFAPTNIDTEFLAQYYETTYWHNEVAQYAAEGARNHGLLNIAASDFFETKLTMPIDSNEQIAIGRFFLKIEEQIFNQAQKFENLKQLKSAYLQRMFI